MLKTLKKAVAFSFLLLAFNAGAADTQYVENKHYKIVSQSLSDSKEVREFFSFYCSHCFEFKNTFRFVEQHLPTGVKFIASPVAMMGGKMGFLTQQGHALATVLGIEKYYTDALFEKMHVHNDLPQDESYFVELFALLGLKDGEYEKRKNSFPVLAFIGSTNRFVEKYDIQAVPELVVNGKYLVLTESVNTDLELSELVNYLVNKDH